MTLETSKKVLASRFDMQPETLSRNLRDLTLAGLIVVDKNRVTLRNAEIERQFLTMPDPGLAEVTAGHPMYDELGCRNAAVPADDTMSQCRWINGAGRQRALSQRMAKSWLMLELGLLTRQSRLILRQSVKQFESRLHELEIETAGTDNQATCTELARLWPRYRGLLDVPPNPGDAGELFALNEEVLDVADQLARGFARSEGTRKGELVNLAGRGRMLSQRAAKYFMFRQMGIKVANCRTRLDEANAEFVSALGELKQSARHMPGFCARIESSATLWKLFRAAMETGNPGDFPHIARNVFRISEDLLNRTDAMVEHCVGLPADTGQELPADVATP